MKTKVLIIGRNDCGICPFFGMNLLGPEDASDHFSGYRIPDWCYLADREMEENNDRGMPWCPLNDFDQLLIKPVVGTRAAKAFEVEE